MIGFTAARAKGFGWALVIAGVLMIWASPTAGVQMLVGTLMLINGVIIVRVSE